MLIKSSTDSNLRLNKIIIDGSEDFYYGCKSCPDNMISPQGAYICNTCDTNYYYDEAQLKCMLCPDGYSSFPNTLGISNCFKKQQCLDDDYTLKYSECVDGKMVMSFILDSSVCVIDPTKYTSRTIQCYMCREGESFNENFNRCETCKEGS
jgi:hypothetical protein